MKETREYILEGLGCANCATKIEELLKVLEGVNDAFVNFSTGTLILEIEQVETEPRKGEQLFLEVQKIIRRIEPGVTVHERRKEKTKQQDMQSIQNMQNIQSMQSIRDKQSKPDGGEKKRKRAKLLCVGIGIFLYFRVLVFSFTSQVELFLFFISYLLIGGEVVYQAVMNISRGQVFDENFLMTIATIGAFAIGEYPEAVAVMLFYQVGETFQEYAVNRSRRSIQALMDIRPDYANVKKGEEIVSISPEQVAIGDYIIIKPGERVPLDGKIIEGSSLVDTSALTGEAVPQELQEGDGILSGSINTTGLLVVKVSKEYGQSTVAKILDLVQYASGKKAPTENFITKFARIYTPIVVSIAVMLAILPPLMMPGAVFNDWLYRALVFLVISCPCALVVSIPLSFFGGIGGASRRGILVKGGNYLEALNNVKAVVFDKTGTLTKGVFKVTAVYPASGFNQKQVLKYAALAEAFSTHPVAKSILEAYGRDVSTVEIQSYEEIAGYGVKVVTQGKTILVGNRKLLEKEDVSLGTQETVSTKVKTDTVVTAGTVFSAVTNTGTDLGTNTGTATGTITGTITGTVDSSRRVFPSVTRNSAIEDFVDKTIFAGANVYIAVDGRYAGHLVIADEIKEDSRQALQGLKKLGVQKLVMLTGDSKKAALQVADELQIEEFYAELLPHEKVAQLEKIHQTKGKGNLVFVGDGINDAPVLARADVGVAMGGLGSDAAIEAADVVIMTDEPSQLVTAIKVARRTHQIVWQNIFLALTVKILVLVLGAVGVATMWAAVFADVGVALVAILNALRVMRV